jgi:hypothetical protein
VWVKLDDGLTLHPKMVGLSDAAFRAYVTGLVYAGRYLTDGVLSDAFVQTIATSDVRAELVVAGLWEESTDAVQIHDFLDFNPSRAEVEAERRRKSEGGKLGAARRWGNRDGRARNEADSMASAMGDPMVHPTGGSNAPDPTRKRKTPPNASTRRTRRSAARDGRARTNSQEGDERGDDALPVAGTIAFARLMQAVGGGEDARRKLERTVAANHLAEADIVAALEAATGRGVNDKLAVALSTLKKRRAA